MRLDGWEQRLDAALEAARHEPFAWGKNDCVLFACTVVAALTGVDHGARVRGRYKSQRGAFTMLRRIWGGNVDVAATKALGEPLEHPLCAQRGDVVAVQMATGDMALGISTGRHIAVAGEMGLSFFSITQALTAWRV